MAAVLGDLAQLVARSLDAVGGGGTSHEVGGEMTRLSIGGKSRNGMNLSQARSQVAAAWGYLTPMSDSEKSVRACQAASWLGAV